MCPGTPRSSDYLALDDWKAFDKTPWIQGSIPGTQRLLPASARPFFLQVPLVAALGIGAHFSKNALAPAEPELESLGLSPWQYATIFAAPTIGAILFPTFWGFAYGKCELAVLLLVPSGILGGQLIIATGLALQDDAHPSVAEAMFVFGLGVLSVFRAGGEVVQHTILARTLPTGCLASGFVVLVFTTHLVTILCNLIVPTELSGHHGEHDSSAGPEQSMLNILHLQLVLTIPSVIGVLAACILCRELRHMRSLPRPPSYIREVSNDVGMPRPSPNALICWGALSVGGLHALQSITNGFLASLGNSPIAAGTSVGQCQAIALMTLPFVAVLADIVGKERLLVSTSLLALCAALTMLLATADCIGEKGLQGALLAQALANTLAPVISLAMLPQATQEPGTAYGLLDAAKSLTQALSVLLFGVLREGGGFPLAIGAACAAFVFVLALAISLSTSGRSPLMGWGRAA